MPRSAPAASRPMVRKAAPRRKAPSRQRAVVARAVSSHPPARAYSYSNPGPVGRAGRAVGNTIGRFLGGGPGAMLGERVGGLAHYIGKIFGSGDYVTSSNQVKMNVLVNEGQIPQFQSGPNVVHVRHREYLGDIISSSSANTFQLTSYNINPGLALSFPWLSQVCGSTFQQYRINGMVFEYRTMSSDALNSTNTALGSVIMATDYDSADSAFTSKAQMENTEFGVSCKPSSSMIHAIECARTQTSVSEQYIRAGAVPANADIRLYDLGKFYIATTGFQGTSVNCGELWVTYDITLFKAIQQPPGYLIQSAHYQLNPANLATQPLSLLASGTAFDTIGLTVTGSGTVLNFPYTIPINSWWSVSVNHSTNAGGATSASQFNITVGNGFVDHGKYTYPNPNPAAAAVREMGFYNFIVQYTGGGTSAALPQIGVGAASTPFSSYVSGDLIVTQLNGNYAP